MQYLKPKQCERNLKEHSFRFLDLHLVASLLGTPTLGLCIRSWQNFCFYSLFKHTGFEMK